MQSIAPTTPPTRNDLSTLTVDELRQRLLEAATVTARGLYETALIYEELRQRGEPVEQMRLALAPYLTKIARGELAPEAVVGLAGFRSALDRVALLPLQRQREIVTQNLPVVVSVDGAEPLVQTKRITDMTIREIRAVISDDGRILEPAAQAEMIRIERKSRSRSAPRAGRPPSIAIEGDYITIGSHTMRRSYLIDTLRNLKVIT